MAVNVLGTPLQECGTDPLTGFFRDGCCNTGADDMGIHTVCALMTEEFLEFSASAGNDLSTPRPGFAGLKPGDRWCLCAPRWQEDKEAGMAPKGLLAATHILSLEWVDAEALRAAGVDRPD